MLSLEDVIDHHLSSIIVDALGGPYHALALRATSRKFRALIMAPEHLTKPSDIAIVLASLGNTRACIRKLNWLGHPQRNEETCRSAALEAALHDHRDLCWELFDIDSGIYGRALMEGAAIKRNNELCADIVTWTTECRGWKDVWYLDTKKSIFGGLMMGAIDGGNMEMVKFLRKRFIDITHAEPDYEGPLFRAADTGRADICRTIHDWMVADGQSCNVEFAMLCAVNGGHEALAMQISTWGLRDLYKVAFVAARGRGDVRACDFMRKLIKKETPHEYVDAVMSVMETAIQRRNMPLFIVTQDWIVDARGRASTLDELRATLDLAEKSGSAEIAEKIREQLRTRGDK